MPVRAAAMRRGCAGERIGGRTGRFGAVGEEMEGGWVVGGPDDGSGDLGVSRPRVLLWIPTDLGMG